MVRVVNLRKPGRGHVKHVCRPSIFGNPVVLGKRCPECNEVHKRDPQMKALVCYGRYLIRRLDSDEDSRFEIAVASLIGFKRIGCWCSPAACHADLLALYVNARATGGRAAAMAELRTRVEEMADDSTRQGDLF